MQILAILFPLRQPVSHTDKCCLLSVTEVRARSVLHAPKSGKVNVLLVTDGLEEGLTGTLVYCVKSDANKEIKMRNIGDVCNY